LCAGMFPNIARISWKGRHGQRVNFQTFEDGQIKLHPSSVNESVKDFEHPWLIYNEKVRTTNLFLRDCSNVPDYALVFFGGAVKRESSSSLSMCRGFYTFSADPQVCELILSLRTQLDGLLQRHIKQPQLDLAVEGHAIVSAIQRLLNPHGRVIRPPDVMRTSDYSDWHCPQCNDLQFARNDICRMCGTPRPHDSEVTEMEDEEVVDVAQQGGRQGDWNCPHCNDLQFARNDNCRMCGTPRDGGLAAMDDGPVVEGGRPGDWNCPQCNDFQFARNDNCRRCGTPRPLGGIEMDDDEVVDVVEQGGRPGDWNCPQCNDFQFARNDNCRRCGEPRPGDY